MLPGRTILVKARVPNGQWLLQPGMFIEARLVTAVRPNAVVVPEEAVVPAEGSNAVWAVVDGKADRRLVTLGVRDLARSIAFYEAIGCKRKARSAEGVGFFSAGLVTLAVYPIDALARDAGIETSLAGDMPKGFRGVELAWNCHSEQDVDAAIRQLTLKQLSELSWIEEWMAEAKTLGAPYELVKEVAQAGRLPDRKSVV